jgi:hypothetical protein
VSTYGVRLDVGKFIWRPRPWFRYQEKCGKVENLHKILINSANFLSPLYLFRSRQGAASTVCTFFSGFWCYLQIKFAAVRVVHFRKTYFFCFLPPDSRFSNDEHICHVSCLSLAGHLIFRLSSIRFKMSGADTTKRFFQISTRVGDLAIC